MASFFSFLAQSVDEEVVYWTEPYLGFSTGAMQTTAATPIFENSEFKTLLGVVGVDVHLGLVQDKFGTSTDQAKFKDSEARGDCCALDFACAVARYWNSGYMFKLLT
eukprot:3900996-Rhodomonas_salina.3